MEPKRTKCPFCNSRKRDLKIWEEDGVVRFYCFGGSCGKRGVLKSGTYISTQEKNYKFVLSKDVDYADREETSKFVLNKYFFTPRVNTVFMDKERTLLELPLYFNGAEATQGSVTKLFNSPGLKSVFKSKTTEKVYNDFTARTGIYGVFGHLVVFEDILSSLKFNELRAFANGVTNTYSCATLSCRIPEKKWLDMAEQTSHLILCLDADATQKSMDYARKYKILFNNGITVLPINKDFKDMDNTESGRFFERLKYVVRN